MDGRKETDKKLPYSIAFLEFSLTLIIGVLVQKIILSVAFWTKILNIGAFKLEKHKTVGAALLE